MVGEEKVKLVGNVHYLLRGNDGDVKLDRWVRNTTTTVGKALVASLLCADVGGTGIDYIAIGVGTPSATALGSESTTNGGARRGGANVVGSLTTTTTTNDTAQFVTTFTFTGELVLTESGLFNASSEGTMLASQSYSAITTADTDTLQITWQVKVS